jgi:hypothetical protein
MRIEIAPGIFAEVQDPEHPERTPKYRRTMHYRPVGTSPAAPQYGPRKPLREVRKELKEAQDETGEA